MAERKVTLLAMFMAEGEDALTEKVVSQIRFAAEASEIDVGSFVLSVRGVGLVEVEKLFQPKAWRTADPSTCLWVFHKRAVANLAYKTVISAAKVSCWLTKV